MNKHMKDLVSACGEGASIRRFAYSSRTDIIEVTISGAAREFCNGVWQIRNGKFLRPGGDTWVPFGVFYPLAEPEKNND